jgi:YfiH family protein
MVSSSSPVWLQANGWSQFFGLAHGFSSCLPEQNISSGFDMTGLTLWTVQQVHGDELVVVAGTESWTRRPEADGILTSTAGVLLGIATADCVPVLMVEPARRVVAALHAGWRGTLKGISVRAVERLQACWGIDPQQLWVAIGPAIDSCCYEVGREVGEAIARRWKTHDTASWQPQGDKGLLNLRAINVTQCERSGVPRTQIQLVGPCTFCGSQTFASYRREGANTGRQLSVIGWRNS